MQKIRRTKVKQNQNHTKISEFSTGTNQHTYTSISSPGLCPCHRGGLDIVPNLMGET